jgi:hypothetical protein
MKSNRSLRIVLGAALLVFALGAFQRWFAGPKPVPSPQPHQSTAAISQNSGMAPLQRPTTPSYPTPRAIYPRTSVQPSPGLSAKLFVEWKGTWYPAEIIASSGNSNLIHYTGYGTQWDEWVTAERMRYSTEETGPKPLEHTAEQPLPEPSPRMNPMPGDTVVHWGSRWWRADVLKVECRIRSGVG